MATRNKKKNDKKARAKDANPESKAGDKTTSIPLPQRGALGRKKPRLTLVSVLASATGTSPIVLAALKTAYGWTERTRLAKGEFLRKRDEWLAKPAREV